MQGMRVAAEPLSAPPYATECTMTLSGTGRVFYLFLGSSFLAFKLVDHFLVM